MSENNSSAASVVKPYYVNFCVSRLYTPATEDRQTIVEMPSDYLPLKDAKLVKMREAIDAELLFFTDNGAGITIKSFSRMDI